MLLIDYSYVDLQWGKKASGAERKNIRKLDTALKIGAEGPVFAKEIRAVKERFPALH